MCPMFLISLFELQQSRMRSAIDDEHLIALQLYQDSRWGKVFVMYHGRNLQDEIYPSPPSSSSPRFQTAEK